MMMNTKLIYGGLTEPSGTKDFVYFLSFIPNYVPPGLDLNLCFQTSQHTLGQMRV